MRKPKAFFIFVWLLLAVQVFFVSKVAAEERTVDSKTVERLERLIKEQQQQLDSLQQQLNPRALRNRRRTAIKAETSTSPPGTRHDTGNPRFPFMFARYYSVNGGGKIP